MLGTQQRVNTLRAAARLYTFQRHLSATTPLQHDRSTILQSHSVSAASKTWRDMPLAITYDDVLLVPKVTIFKNALQRNKK